MSKRGFTLIELLVVIAVLSTILGLGLTSYSGFNRKERLKQSALTVKSIIRLAQIKAISAEKPRTGCTTFVGMRVSFAQSSYELTHTCSPEGDVGSSDTYILPSDVTFSPVPSEFTFQMSTNTLNVATDQTITLTNGSQSYALVVSPSGNVHDGGFQ